MKDELEMIFSDKDSDIEKISSRYKAVDDKRKEKIYEITKRKYDILRAGEGENSDDGFIVSAEGVERYSRPRIYRYISAAAAALVLCGGAFGGVMLSRSSKVQQVSSSSNIGVTEATTEGAVNTDIFSDDAVVDKLLTNLEMIQRPQYPEADSVDLSSGIYFNKDEYSAVSDSIVKLTKYYYAVTDERLDSMSEAESVLRDTFIYETAASYLGGDLSSHEVGYDFKDDSMANKYVKAFIEYNGKVYAQSQAEPNASYAYGFDGLYNFSSYKLVSSKFEKGGMLLYMDRVMYDENSEPVSLEKLVTCKRVYERPDGNRIAIDIQLLPENDVWKIAAYDLNTKSDGNDTEQVESKFPVLEDNKASDGEYAELQLHENIICQNMEEAEALTYDINNALDNKVYTFKKVDTEKYAQQIMDSGSYEELNSLENKSYIYHLTLNSYRYFDTVDLTFEYRGSNKEGSWNKTEHCLADNRGKYIYVDYEFNSGESHDLLSIYQYDNKWIDADNRYKQYYVTEMDDIDFNEQYVPDNYRFISFYNSEGQQEVYSDFRTVVFGQLGSDCLYLSGGDMQDFDYWHIERTENLLGRQCAVISNDQGYYKTEKYIDLKTGIVLKYSEQYLDTGEVDEMNVTAIDIDQPLDYVYFDPTGYTEQS